MTEACEAVTDFWFNTLNFPFSARPNDRQHRLSPHLRKAGMRLVATEDRDYVSGRFPLKSGKSPPRMARPQR